MGKGSTKIGPGASGNDEVLQAVLSAVSGSLGRRGFFTSEWWTTLIGGALSAVLALVHVNGSTATQVVAVVAPALLAAVYAIVRTMHKSALASALGDIFPQGGQAGPPPGGAVGQLQQQVPAQASVGAVAQTDPDFAFEGIPPIEEPQ